MINDIGISKEKSFLRKISLETKAIPIKTHILIPGPIPDQNIEFKGANRGRRSTHWITHGKSPPLFTSCKYLRSVTKSGCNLSEFEKAYGWKTRKVPIAINPETETRATKKENASDRLALLVPLSQLLLKAVNAKAKTGAIKTMKPVNFDAPANPQKNPILSARIISRRLGGSPFPSVW